MIRELTVSEVEQVSGAGFFGDIWDSVKSAAHHVGSFVQDVGDVVGKVFTSKYVAGGALFLLGLLGLGSAQTQSWK